SSPHVFGKPVVAHHRDLAIDHLHAELYQITENVSYLTVRVIPDVHASLAHPPEHLRVAGFENPPPRFRLDEQTGLAAPVVGKVQAVIIELGPLVNPSQVEIQQVVEQAVKRPGLAGNIHQEVF